MSLSPDEQRVAVTSQTGATTGELTIIEVGTGAVLQTAALAGGFNFYWTTWQDASPLGTYTPFGAGCAGTLGVASLDATPGSRPAIGETFELTIDNLPFGIAAVATGLSNTITSIGIPLPLDLGIIGMPGCPLLVDNLVLDLVVGGGTSATWSWTLPDDRTCSACGSTTGRSRSTRASTRSASRPATRASP